MADLIHKDVRTYSRIETNERQPTIKEIEIISTRLNIEPEELLWKEPRITFESCNNNQNLCNYGTIHFNTQEVSQLILMLNKTLETFQNFLMHQIESTKK